ncbi:MAG: single-stranded-DNA-specific exonuclease RecJ [Proteobacteria bacterium]|nr:single-stranded-DNA-specific exonuclease RecJ [Pseudomonadota bacterium]HQR02648.1 single-stranded-DNA-specific exonuclease RecJ [Rhodocyclaceae bacterium]
MTRIVTRSAPARAVWTLEQAGIPALLARLYAARGIRTLEETETGLDSLIPPNSLMGAEQAAILLADAIAANQRLLIVADYDCDGATACAVGLRALRAFGAHVEYLVPNRFELGYGLSPEVVHLAAQRKPDLIITVDNGIASNEGVTEANRLGIRTLITDHHLPGAELPAATVIVNPNQPGCIFPSKALAGVGVMFYVMLALRSELRRRGVFSQRAEPNLGTLLDLVALGSVADVVPLDRNNRILVAQGLARMREGRLQPGIRALFRVAGRQPEAASTFDLGFALGPRLNAAGRLADMALGIECLATDDPGYALNIAQQLDALNRERRTIETGMREDAERLLAGIEADDRASITLFDPGWHQGVVGILAGRVKEKLHRPTFAFARGDQGQIKGSGRSITGFHLRDALDLIAKRHPGMLLRFGGHGAAAGATLQEADLPTFSAALERVAQEQLSSAALSQMLESDGALESGFYSLDSAHLLKQAVWGQGFPQPLFDDRFKVESQRLLQGKHLKMVLCRGGCRYDAIWFNAEKTVAGQIHAAFRLDINEYQGCQSVQLIIEDCVTVPAGTQAI